MTQDVQPLTWQKRTNIEEHQQFFSKINEIIDNLAPTVDEAEAAIAQATQAIADANAAIATANAASAAADAAAQQAQTAASTVAGYDSRLTTVEGEADTNADNITALQGRMGTAEGNITALQGVQADYVKKAGAAQTVTSQIMVPTTATGTRDTQIANGTRIQNDLDAYAPMLRTTGKQTSFGIKIFETVTGKMSYHQRITGTSKIELFRIQTNAAMNVGIHMIGMSRGTGFAGQIAVAFDGVSSISMSHSVNILYGSAGQSALYAYYDTVTSELVIAAGNEQSGNNYISVIVAGVYSGAGIEQPVSFEGIGTYRTDVITESTTKYVWCSS